MIYPSKYSILSANDANVTLIRKFGACATVSSAAESVLWTPGGPYPWPTVARTVRVASGGNVNDTAAGTGARTITVEGLDSNWDFASETITLAGASASTATSTVFIRVFRAYVTTCGTYTGTNAGDITVEDSSAVATLAVIPAGISQTEMMVYSVPRGHVAFVTRASASSETSKPVVLSGLIRLNGDTVSAPFAPARKVFRRLSLEIEFQEEFTTPDRLPEKSDIWMSAIKTGAGTASVYAELDILQIKVD